MANRDFFFAVAGVVGVFLVGCPKTPDAVQSLSYGLPPLEVGSCGPEEPLTPLQEYEAVGVAEGLHLHVIGQMHPPPTGNAHVTPEILGCQVQIYRTLLDLVEQGIPLITVEGTDLLMAPPSTYEADKTACEILGNGRGTVATSLVSQISPVPVLGWEDPLLHEISMTQVKLSKRLVTEQDRLRNQMAAIVERHEETIALHTAAGDLLKLLLPGLHTIVADELVAVELAIERAYGPESPEMVAFKGALANQPASADGDFNEMALEFVDLVDRVVVLTGIVGAMLESRNMGVVVDKLQAAKKRNRALFGPYTVARSATAVANTMMMMEQGKIDEAALVIGAIHLDDLAAMRNMGEPWPAMTIYSCLEQPAPKRTPAGGFLE